MIEPNLLNPETPSVSPTPVSPPVPLNAVATVQRCQAPPLLLRFKEEVLKNFIIELTLVLGQNGRVYIVKTVNGVHRAYLLGSRKANQILHNVAKRGDIPLDSRQLAEINQRLMTYADSLDSCCPVYCRVAPSEEGIEIDCGHSIISISPGHVELEYKQSRNVFYTNPISLQLPVPAEQGDLGRLSHYVNLNPAETVMFIAWLSYTLAHPKIKSSKYLILVIHADQGAGKSSLCQHIILPLIDPSRAGLQKFPSKESDFAIAANNAHVLCYDNMRNFKQSMADTLCMASTGGTVSSRALYTNDEQHIQHLHVALVLNGIHSFINEADLAERCLTIRPNLIPEQDRRSEDDMLRDLERDLPVIFRGLLTLIAAILEKLPEVQVVHPKRMIDFVRWLGAIELIEGVKPGLYQKNYADRMTESQLDSLHNNLLAASILDFVDGGALKDGEWHGSPSELLTQLNNRRDVAAKYAKDWPDNAISLSKRLNSLKASLLTQRIRIEFERGRSRTIRIVNLDYGHRDPLY